MTHSSKQVRARRSSNGWARRAATAAALASALFWATGCDTAAEIPFGTTHFQTIYPGAMGPADGGTCGAIDENAVMNMVFVDNNGEVVTAGDEELTGVSEVAPERDDVSFSDGRLYSLPDVECDNGCAGGLSCEPLDVQDSPGDRCQDTTVISAHSDLVEAREHEPDSQAFALAISNSAIWEGFHPAELSEVYRFEEDEDGEWNVGSQVDPSRVSGLNIDPDGERFTALEQAAGSWSGLNEQVAEDERDAYFGLWSFDYSTINSPLEEITGELWTSSGSDAADAVDAYDDAYSVTANRQRMNIYEAMSNTLEEAFGDEAVSEVDNATIVFLVPGHDQRGRDDAEDVIATAEGLDVDVAVTIVQVDTPRDTDLIVDDWDYYQHDHRTECSNNDDCANFESCRQPASYTDDPHASDEDDIYRPRQEDRGETFCLPDYDEEGRLGPIADYDRIACETGGAYHYIPRLSRSLLEEHLRGQVLANEASWQVQFSIDDQDRLEYDGGANLLQTQLDVDIGREQTFRFNRPDEERDRRRVFFTPEQ